MGTVNGGLFDYNPHSSRLKWYDYTHPGAYFITICTYARICFFGEIKEGRMFLSRCGEIVHSCWYEIPQHFPHVQSFPFVVMPNHIHGIITISKRLPSVSPHVETRHAVSKREAFQKPVPDSLPTIIRSFKAAVTKKLNESGEYLPATIWQRNYYEHVIRNEKELNQAAEYINFNPVNWEIDNDNPSALRHIK
jgi:REP element-mobilizing transposase RayT